MYIFSSGYEPKEYDAIDMRIMIYNTGSLKPLMVSKTRKVISDPYFCLLLKIDTRSS
jgi:hypothetical protein